MARDSPRKNFAARRLSEQLRRPRRALPLGWLPGPVVGTWARVTTGRCRHTRRSKPFGEILRRRSRASANTIMPSAADGPKFSPLGYRGLLARASANNCVPSAAGGPQSKTKRGRSGWLASSTIAVVAAPSWPATALTCATAARHDTFLSTPTESLRRGAVHFDRT